jgi:hypothetical protein
MVVFLLLIAGLARATLPDLFDGMHGPDSHRFEAEP